MFTLNWNGKEKDFGSFTEAVAFQTKLREEGYGSDLWYNDTQCLRSVYKESFTGKWIVETTNYKGELQN